MRSTRFWYCRNCFASPTFSARSRRPMNASVAAASAASGGSAEPSGRGPGGPPQAAPRRLLRAGRGPVDGALQRGLRAAAGVLDRGGADALRPDLAVLAALVGVALDLAAELLLAEVHRVPQVPRAVARAEGRPLEVQGGLGHLRVADRRVALLPDLHLQARQLGDLTAHAAEAPHDVLPKLVGDG